MLDDADISSIRDHEKYKMRKHHFEHNFNFSFPKKILHKHNCSSKLEYLTQEFVRSKNKDSFFLNKLCFVCLQKSAFSEF